MFNEYEQVILPKSLKFLRLSKERKKILVFNFIDGWYEDQGRL